MIENCSKEIKVGLLTFHSVLNFGAVLQAFALQSVITRLGISTEIIDYQPSLVEEPDRCKFRKYLNFPKLFRYYKFYLFRKQNLVLSTKVKTLKQLTNSFSSSYEIYISGSDQIWGYGFKKKFGDSYFLNFVSSCSKKVAYAASMDDFVPVEEINSYKQLISRYDYVSIRERSNLEFINSCTLKKVEIVLDPTMLIDPVVWETMSLKKHKSQPYLLLYNLQDNDYVFNISDKVSSMIGLDIKYFKRKKNKYFPINSFFIGGPIEFLSYCKNAEYIITNSFHGVCFAIIFHKEFYAIPHTSRGTRVVDLLCTLKLQERILYNGQTFEKLNAPIDWKSVDKILEVERNRSLVFLKHALGVR